MYICLCENHNIFNVFTATPIKFISHASGCRWVGLLIFINHQYNYKDNKYNENDNAGICASQAGLTLA